MSETKEKKEVEISEAPSVVTKDAVASEPTHLKNDAEDLGKAVVKPTDPDGQTAAKKVSKVKDQVNKDENDGSLPKDNKPSGMKEEEAVVQGEEEIAEDKVEDSEMEIDLSDDVKALVSTDADLSEEFKDKAATIFETAVRTRIKEQTKILEAQFEEKLSAEKETMKEAMVEKVDSYLNYVVEEWMKENELAVERGIRTEIAEDFITGLKDLFKEHYIDVPEEKYNVLDDLTNQVKDLESKLDEQKKELQAQEKELKAKEEQLKAQEKLKAQERKLQIQEKELTIFHKDILKKNHIQIF